MVEQWIPNPTVKGSNPLLPAIFYSYCISSVGRGIICESILIRSQVRVLHAAQIAISAYGANNI